MNVATLAQMHEVHALDKLADPEASRLQPGVAFDGPAQKLPQFHSSGIPSNEVVLNRATTGFQDLVALISA